MATPLLWTRQPDVIGAVGLALNAAAERNGYPDVCERIGDLLVCAATCGGYPSTSRTRRSEGASRRLVFQLIHLADIEAVDRGCLSSR